VFPTPTPTPTPTLTPRCYGYPAASETTNIRELPTTMSSIVGEITNTGIVLLARFPTGSPGRWDDWYLVGASGANDGYGWVRADVTYTSPRYGMPCGLPVWDASPPDIISPEEIPTTLTEPLEAPADFIPEAALLFEPATHAELRLPALFTQLPMVDSAEFTSSQGYGLNSFAYRHPNYYDATNHIHSGLDFFALDSTLNDCATVRTCFQVVPICDGEVISLNGTTGGNTGSGVVIRCFSPDGSYSNIYVSYNHLQDTGDLEAGQLVGAGSQHSLNTFQYTGNTDVHLHLELFFDRDGNLDNAIRLNPLIFFNASVREVIVSVLEAYYPDISTDIGDDRRFEWEPADTDDPAAIDGQTFDAVNFNNGNNGLSALEAETSADMDLGIRMGELNEVSILADRAELAAGDAAICTYVWGRTDQSIYFRYRTGESPLACPLPLAGIQVVPTQNGYDGPDWLSERWIRSDSDLLNALRGHDE